MHTKLQELLPVLLLCEVSPRDEAVKDSLTLCLNKPCVSQHST